MDSSGLFSSAGKRLKSTSGWYDNGNGLDTYGFSVLATGNKSGDSYYYSAGKAASIWSSTENANTYANELGFYYFDSSANLHKMSKSSEAVVRCLKD